VKAFIKRGMHISSAILFLGLHLTILVGNVWRNFTSSKIYMLANIRNHFQIEPMLWTKEGGGSATKNVSKKLQTTVQKRIVVVQKDCNAHNFYEAVDAHFDCHFVPWTMADNFGP
jgi:hypothetical protein